MTTEERTTLARLIVALGATLTKRGHVAARVEWESAGYCSHRRCAPVCIQTRTLLHEALDVLERAVEAPTQPGRHLGVGGR